MVFAASDSLGEEDSQDDGEEGILADWGKKKSLFYRADKEVEGGEEKGELATLSSAMLVN